MIDSYDVIIVGTGHGGAQAAISLRQCGYQGSILMVSRDGELPYERPPLSKEYLAKQKPFERILIRPAQFWIDRQIGLRLSNEVVAVDPEKHQVTLKTGEELKYSALIWAAGGEPRKLSCPGAELGGIFGVRNRADVDEIMAAIDQGARRIVVIGGGYIGLEAAAVLRKLGLDVVLVEALPRVLARVAGAPVSLFFQTEHASAGVDLRLGVGVEKILGTENAEAVQLSDGQTISADLVIVGVGIIPNVEPLINAGAAGENGVLVDEYCQTSLEDIYAIGDCAAHASQWADDQTIRLESVQNANDMATAVAKTICGVPQIYRALPWFWSNQYDLKMQTAGLSAGYTSVVLRGDPAHKKFSALYFNKSRLIAIDAINMTKDFVQGRKLIEAKVTLQEGEASDIFTDLKSFL